MATEERY